MADEQKLLIEMQNKQLELLKELDRVCRRIGVQYYLSSGSCLGALRHQGFIPWDDDIDVYMYWEDAEKLADNQHLFREQFFVQSRKTDPRVRTISYSLRDSSTALFLKGGDRDDINHGIYIDIYVLYPYPDNWLYGKKVVFDSIIHRILVAGNGPQNHGTVLKLVGNCINWFYGKRAEKKIDAVEKEYRENGGKKYVATYFGKDAFLFHTIIYPREWFTKPAKLMFEGMEVNCPGDPHAYCRLQYGDSYMELPPVEKRKPHHDFLFASTTEPYTKYKGIYY